MFRSKRSKTTNYIFFKSSFKLYFFPIVGWSPQHGIERENLPDLWKVISSFITSHFKTFQAHLLVHRTATSAYPFCIRRWTTHSPASYPASAGTRRSPSAPYYCPSSRCSTSPTPSARPMWTPVSCTAAGGTPRGRIRNTRILYGKRPSVPSNIVL